MSRPVLTLRVLPGMPAGCRLPPEGAGPQELSIAGFDDIELARYVTPALTTVHQPRVRLGNMATEVLLDLLDGRPVQNHVLLPTLVARAGTAPR